ncbi:phosphate ABC transporter substrate-binding protein [Sporolactobacillus inulinus]|jgi:phosphate transport system substrate-binding protein|uniref:Phosphate-binding protein n=2 Tax=Sporolactobacillus inulinus TaxID=2078 RepID=A0A4Y3T2M6_9BACL|nr:phosphate ABC transporter substrate-binding protein [Sporolactobacillus inulinus]KLI01452.1 phosphate-binding protein [Sporolactobacillus inulinus CASD]GAY74997.1 phosphate ABC transporter [Sporolactobacillus inulinus]GEB75703.1 phosphate-binding protein PstS [Sporolactobacillus inulinus]
MKKKNLLAIGLVFILSLTLVLSGCGNSSSGSSSDASKSESSSSAALSGKLTIGGSTALQPLAAQAAKEFMEKNPDVQIEVQGGGSGTGLSETQAGNFDIGMSDVFAESKSNVDAKALKDYKVAVVGMTAAVNPKVGVKNLSKKDLQDVFTGKVKNWKEVGGKNQKITLVNRPDGSGTRATFDQFALDNKTPAEGITQDSTNTVKKIVADTPGAIGYMALSYFTANDDSVVKLSIDGVEASDANVASGEFPVWAYEHMYTKGEPSKLAKAFLDFMMSDDVQTKDVPAQGYLSVKDMKVERDATGKQTDK